MAQEHEKPFDNTLRTSGELCRFLLECTEKLGTNGNGVGHRAVFLEEFSAVALPVGAVTPFTDFTGQQERSTVIFSGHLTKDFQLEPKLGESLSEISNDAEVEQDTTDVQQTLSLSTFKVIKIGQTLSQKRVFLTKSEPL